MTDDILLFGKNEHEHHENLMRVLERLERSGVTLNLKKCELYKKQLIFFGLRFISKGVGPTEERCKALKEAHQPKNASELRNLLSSALFSGN